MIESSAESGGLYLGGFKGVMNEQFLKDSNIKYVVNTAKGLEIFGPKYLVCVLYIMHTCSVELQL